MTGIRIASLDANALDIGHWIRSESGRTLANRAMVVRDADGVGAA